jgi:hypothetical protein
MGYVDPTDFDPARMAIVATATGRVPLQEIRQSGTDFNVTRAALGADRLFVWRRK